MTICTSPRNKSLIESKEKPVTIRTGPTADPAPQKQSLNQTNEQNRQSASIPANKKDVKIPPGNIIFI